MDLLEGWLLEGQRNEVVRVFMQTILHPSQPQQQGDGGSRLRKVSVLMFVGLYNF